MNILLTGATGVIGREVLTELLLSKLHSVQTIYCTVRSKKNQSAGERFMELIGRIAMENNA